MVKKSSFLEKLFARKKVEQDKSPAATRESAGDRRISGARPTAQQPARGARVVVPESRTGAAKTPEPRAKIVKPEPVASDRLVIQSGAKPEPKPQAEKAPEAPSAQKPSTGSSISRVISGKGREDAAVALKDGFRELGSLLQGIHQRMDEQGQQSSKLNEKFIGLPDMAKAQVDFMSKVSEQLIEQKEKTGELLDKLSDLPTLLDGIHKTLERQAAVEERTEKNLRDFRSTMDRIHNSVGELTAQSQNAVTKTAESFERTNSRTTRAFEETQKQAYDTFRQSQEQSLNQLTKIVEKSSKSNRGIAVMLGLVFVAIVVLTVVLINAQ